MAKVINNTIQDLNVSWENYAGSSVEELIKRELKSRCGYLYRTPSKIGDYYYIYGFMSLDDFEQWQTDGKNSHILFRVQLPNIENDSFSVSLSTNSNTNKLVNLGNGVKVNLRYTSTATNPSTNVTYDTYNDGTLIILRSSNGSAYQEVARVGIKPFEQNKEGYTVVDITPYLADGDNAIRIRVEDDVNGSISNNINFRSIINTTLKIENATDTQKPLENFILQYYIQGQVAKTLNVKITDEKGSKTFSTQLGTNTYTEVPYNFVIEDEYESGVKTVESWLTVDDTVLESDHITNQFYFLSGGSSKSVIVLNNVAKTITNYANTKLFDFVVYNKMSNVSIKITDGTSTLLEYTYNDVNLEQNYSFYNTLEVESTVAMINATLTVKTADMTVTESIVIDNREDFNPVAGADFVLNPKTRSNTEKNPFTIINDVNGSTVNATFLGFKAKNDLWVDAGTEGKVLRIPAGRSLTIEYDPLDNLTEGTTVEYVFKTFNIFDSDEVIFSFCNYADGNPIGYEMKPLEAVYMTTEQKTKRDQDIMFDEEERTHIAINILPNVSGKGINYVRLFINGTINREFIYTDTDIFKNGKVNIKIGSNNNDIDIYSLTVYKKGLSAADIRKNVASKLPTIEEKIAYRTANDIVSSDGTISYDKAVNKYNTIVWTGKVPSYATGNVKYTGFADIKKLGDKAHSGRITKLRAKGQGSSSRGYDKWNQQHDWQTGCEFINELGETFTDGYKLIDDMIPSKCLVGKVNWASSMQSHKMGSVNLFTDLWRAIIGGNSITRTEGFENARVSVYEEPFMFFVREKESDQPKFYALMTYGPGKDDAMNFGYDENVFPDYLCVEGSDNGMPLTLRQVPWLDDEVTYNDDEEYWEYAGAGNLDLDRGNMDKITYFKSAFNFVYQHNPFVEMFNGDLTALNKKTDANPAYQYINSTTYDVYRYDYISEMWVDGGLERTRDCEYHYTTEEDVNNGLADEAGIKVIDVIPVYTKFNAKTQTGKTTAADIRAWRINDFKTKIGTMYSVNDVLFCMAFLKFIGASDNWCKNTYEYLDPVTHIIRMAQDDMDTIFATDNVGRKTKPYYVEEHDKNEKNEFYWNGNDNVFYNLMELAFSTEYRGMMKSILDTMSSNEFGGSVSACLERYYLSTQKYFPSVAYNEIARIFYEEAAVKQAAGTYKNGTPAISQSLGDQLQAEKQWLRYRTIYMQSWAAADPFYVRSTRSLGFRSMLLPNSSNPNYSFALTPYIWLYPKSGFGQSMGSDNTRVTAGNVYNTNRITTDGNTDTFIYGADWYTSFGEFGDKSIGETFELSGNRLLEFSADSRKVTNYYFRPISMSVKCPVLKSLVVYGCSTLTGSLDLTNCLKLEKIDLRGSNLSTILFPQSDVLTEIALPNLTSLSIVNCPNLTTKIYYESLDKLNVLTTDNSFVLSKMITFAPNLSEVHLQNINGSAFNSDADRLYNLLINPKSTATGKIQLGKTLTVAEKNVLIAKYGNIDDERNALYIKYDLDTGTSVVIEGNDEIYTGGTIVVTANYSGNDATAYNWTITNAGSYKIENNKVTITAKENSTADITVKVSVPRLASTALNATKVITVTEKIPVTSLKITGATEVYNSGDIVLNVAGNPANYTIPFEITNVTIETIGDKSQESKVTIKSYNTDTVTLNYSSTVNVNELVRKITVTSTDIFGNTATGTHTITFRSYSTYNVTFPNATNMYGGDGSRIYRYYPDEQLTADVEYRTEGSEKFVKYNWVKAYNAVTGEELGSDFITFDISDMDFKYTLYPDVPAEFAIQFKININTTYRTNTTLEWSAKYRFHPVPNYVTFTAKNGAVDVLWGTNQTGINQLWWSLNPDYGFTAVEPLGPNTNGTQAICTLQAGQTVYMYMQGDPNSTGGYSYFKFNGKTDTARVLGGGNLMMLALLSNGAELSPDNVGTDIYPYMFNSMFKDCTILETMPTLPENKTYTIKGSYAFRDCFNGCTALKTIPFNVLNYVADSSNTYTFNRMFYGCTSLTNAPSIVETIVKDPTSILLAYTFVEMYRGCTSLVSCGDIKTSTNNKRHSLGEFTKMFYGCSKLKTINNIEFNHNRTSTDTSQVAYGDFYQTFYNCKALVNAPKIKTSKIRSFTFNETFYGCNKLTHVPVIETNALAETSHRDVFNSMFMGCSALTDVLDMSTLVNGYGTDACHSMYQNCTSLTDASGVNISGTDNVSSNAFFSMFRNCTSLNTIPELRSTLTINALNSGLVDVFRCMYYGCTGLNIVINGTYLPEVYTSNTTGNAAAANDGDGFYREMFLGSGVTGVSFDINKSIKNGRKNMFKNCLSLTTASLNTVDTIKNRTELMVVRDNGYEGMFEGCTALVNVRAGIDWVHANACDSMFKGCTALENTHFDANTGWGICLGNKSKGTGSGNASYQSMFEGCTALKSAPVIHKYVTVANNTAAFSKMFKDCTNLNAISFFWGQDVPDAANNILYGWTQNVAKTGYFTVGSTSISIPRNSTNGIPSGWSQIIGQEPAY